MRKVGEGSPHAVDMLRDGSIQLVVNTTRGDLVDEAALERALKDPAFVARVSRFLDLVRGRAGQRLKDRRGREQRPPNERAHRGAQVGCQ